MSNPEWHFKKKAVAEILANIMHSRKIVTRMVEDKKKSEWVLLLVSKAPTDVVRARTMAACFEAGMHAAIVHKTP